MQAVILAAGRGERLGRLTRWRPKCLVEVGGRSLLQHQVRALRDLGIDRIAVVVGHLGELVRAAMASECEFIDNRRYAETNSLYSLWLARNWLDGPFLLLNGDVLAHTEVYGRVVRTPGTVLAFDSRSGTTRGSGPRTIRGSSRASIFSTRSGPKTTSVRSGSG